MSEARKIVWTPHPVLLIPTREQVGALIQRVGPEHARAELEKLHAKRSGFAHDRDLENGKEEWLTHPHIINPRGLKRYEPMRDPSAHPHKSNHEKLWHKNQ